MEQGERMKTLTHPSSGNKTEELRHWISPKCLLYRRQKPVSWPGKTHQVSLAILRPMNSLSERQLGTPSFPSLSRASPSPQLTSWIASALLFLDKHNFWLSELASAYLLYLDWHYTGTQLYYQNKIIYLYKCACAHIHQRRQRHPTPVFSPGESQGWELGGLPSMGPHRVRHNWRDLAAADIHT